MNFEIVVATSNAHKLKEIREILSPFHITVYGLSDLNLKVEEVEENGSSYQENALIKANAVSKLTSLPILADDSGMEIPSLGNIPGLYSARYAEEKGGYPRAMEAIINEIKDKDRTAKFICDIVVINLEDKPLYFEGIVMGKIDNAPKGELGFGYDPIFIPDDIKKNYALLTNEEKNLVSHRGRALKKFLTYLKINGYAR